MAVLLSAKVAEYEDALQGFREATPHTIVAVFDMDGDLDRGRKQLTEARSPPQSGVPRAEGTG